MSSTAAVKTMYEWTTINDVKCIRWKWFPSKSGTWKERERRKKVKEEVGDVNKNVPNLSLTKYRRTTEICSVVVSVDNIDNWRSAVIEQYKAFNHNLVLGDNNERHTFSSSVVGSCDLRFLVVTFHSTTKRIHIQPGDGG